MVNQKIKELEQKITDYTRFSFILMSLSIFLFVGTIIPDEGIGSLELNLFMAGNITCLALAVYFHKKVKVYQEQLNNQLEQ